MNTKNLNLVTYGLGDVTDWITGFSNNMNLIDNFAGSVDSKIKNVESSTDNLDQQVQNISNELTNFGEEMDTMNTNINSISTRVQQNTSLINAIPKMKKYTLVFDNNPTIRMKWYQTTYNDLYTIYATMTITNQRTFPAGETHLNATFTSMDAPFFRSSVGYTSSLSAWMNSNNTIQYFNTFFKVTSDNKITFTLKNSNTHDMPAGTTMSFQYCLTL